MVSTSGRELSVPFYSGARSSRADMPKLEKRLRRISASGIFVCGNQVELFEEDLRSYTGAEHAVMVSSGTTALTLILKAAGLGRGDEVVIPAYTFFATASSVLHADASPVMVDILPGSYGLDPARVSAVISPRTKAIMPVHLFSQMCDIGSLRDIATERGLSLLEDSAEAIGMRIGHVHAGLFGSAGALSFFPTKTLGALGDAGAVITNDLGLASRVRELRRRGGGADEIQAAVLRTRLEHLDRDIARRAELASLYTQGLADLSPAVATPYLAPVKSGGNQVWYTYLIETDHRDELATFLGSRQVGTEIYYPRPLSAQPSLAALPGARHPIPIATAASRRALALPLYPDLTEAQVVRVCALIRAFHTSGRCA